MPHQDLKKRRLYARDLSRRLRLRKAEKRWNDRAQRLINRTKPSIHICIWAAGHFEGEGTVTLTRGGRVMWVRPLVTLTSTDPEVIDFFCAYWPCARKIRYPQSKTGNVRPGHVWSLNSGERIQAFLTDILPHVVTKRVRDKIAIVLEDIQDRGLYQQQPESHLRSEQRRLSIRKLNAKGLDATVYDQVRPRLAEIAKTGQMVPLLSAPHRGGPEID